VERWETAAYCERHGLQWTTDHSNADVTLTRNRIRHHLLPLLETYNPSVRPAIRRLASLVRDELQLIDTLVDHEWQSRSVIGASSVSFDRATFSEYQRAISSRLLRRAAHHLAAHIALSYDQIDRCLNLVRSNAGSTRLSGDLQWRVTLSRVELARIPDRTDGKDLERDEER
jgi:tRNA(Ile)-lysidine synthase